MGGGVEQDRWFLQSQRESSVEKETEKSQVLLCLCHAPRAAGTAPRSDIAVKN